MKSNKIKLVLLAGAALFAVSALTIAQEISAPRKPLPIETGAKNFQIVDITPPNQTNSHIHVVYNFDNYTVTTVVISDGSIQVQKPVSLLKATPEEADE